LVAAGALISLLMEEKLTTNIKRVILNSGKKKVALTTLGCKVNQYESASFISQFEDQGVEMVPFSKPADVYVINTSLYEHMDRLGFGLFPDCIPRPRDGFKWRRR